MIDRAPPCLISAATLIAERSQPAGVKLLDVRTPAEFESAHIPGAYNVPLDTLSEHAADIAAAVDTPVVLIGQSGLRAHQAEAALHAACMSGLQVLEGGMGGWLAAGGEVVRGTPRMSLERQVRITAGAGLALLVHPLFALIPALVGSGLVFAGLTDTCTMGMLLARLPYNRRAGR